MDFPSYLARIAYSGPIEPTANNLRAVHRAHLFAVPFENLNISLGRPIVIDEGSLIHKIVHLGRGGSFAVLLCALGFQVDMSFSPTRV